RPTLRDVIGMSGATCEVIRTSSAAISDMSSAITSGTIAFTTTVITTDIRNTIMRIRTATVITVTTVITATTAITAPTIVATTIGVTTTVTGLTSIVATDLSAGFTICSVGTDLALLF